MKGYWIVPVIFSILVLGTLGIPHTFAQLCPVTGCLTDNLYVSDLNLDTVRQYDSAGGLLDASFVTGVGQSTIAFDSTGNLYVVKQTLGIVEQYDSAGGLINANFITGLGFPHSIAFDSTGKLYVGDVAVRQYDSAGGLINANFITGGLINPVSIAFDSTGKIYVADPNFGTVRQYDSAGGLLDASFVTGQVFPRSIAFDSTGNLYVADDSTIAPEVCLMQALSPGSLFLDPLHLTLQANSMLQMKVLIEYDSTIAPEVCLMQTLPPASAFLITLHLTLLPLQSSAQEPQLAVSLSQLTRQLC